jgi:hypothetical protein
MLFAPRFTEVVLTLPHRARDANAFSRESAPRDPEDDFFCLRYAVWYPSRDCAFRTKFRTAQGCRDCEQGRFNLKRHAADLCHARFDLAGDQS